MTSKYSLAKEGIADITKRAMDVSIDPAEAQEALIVSLVQTLKETNGADYVRGVLQYEVECLGSGGVFEIQRGSGHS